MDARGGLHVLGGVGARGAGARRRDRRAARFAVLAGDVVPAKKPAPDIYLLALERLGVRPAEALVVEDSRNGLLAATGAGLPCLVTVSSYTVDEDFAEAVLVVTSLGDPAASRTRGAGRPRGPPGRPCVTLQDLERASRRALAADQREVWMGESQLRAGRTGVRTIAETAVENETYFGELDAVVGDGDFGYSLARGFEIVAGRLGHLRPDRHRNVPEEDRGRDHEPDRRHLGTDLGHRLPARRGRRAGKTELTGDDVVAMLRSAIEGIKQRGNSDLGDKTLLDALQPAIDGWRPRSGRRESRRRPLQRAATVAAGSAPRPPARCSRSAAAPLHGRAQHRHARRRGRRGRGDVRTARPRSGRPTTSREREDG